MQYSLLYFLFLLPPGLLSYTNIIPILGKLLNGFMRPIFHVPGQGSFALLMGIISGTPVGAKIVTDFRIQGIVTKEEAERLLAFTNNSGPLFIIGTVGISLLGDTITGFLLLGTHILACLSVGFLFRFWKYTKPIHHYPQSSSCSSTNKQIPATFSNLGTILSKTITDSIHTVVMIGGFIVLFSVIISICNNTHLLDGIHIILAPVFSWLGIDSCFGKPFITGILELTNGVKQVCSIITKNVSITTILCSFLLGFGGISIGLQVFSITSQTDISIKPYFLGKLLQGCFASFYTFLLLKTVPFLNLDLQPVFSSIAQRLEIPTSFSSLPLFSCCLLIFILIWYGKIFLIKKNKLA